MTRLKEETLLALDDFRKELKDIAKAADCLAQEMNEFCGAIEEGEFDQGNELKECKDYIEILEAQIQHLKDDAFLRDAGVEKLNKELNEYENRNRELEEKLSDS